MDNTYFVTFLKNDLYKEVIELILLLNKTPFMNRIYALVFLIFAPIVLNAQLISKINFDEIKLIVSDSTSVNYYPRLIERLVSGDSSLTNKEYKYLYYGNVFQEYYYPYGATKKQKLFSEAYSKGDSFGLTEQLGKEVLHENPVNLGVILKMIFLYNGQKNVEKATVFAKMYVSFLEVIYASGTGKDCADSFVVISVDDEYKISADLGLSVAEQALIGSCDRLIFDRKGQKRKSRIKKLFFNVRIPLTYLSKSYNQSELPEADPSPDENE